MKQYLDKENLLNEIGQVRIYPLDDGLDVAKKIIQESPTANVQELKHASYTKIE